MAKYSAHVPVTSTGTNQTTNSSSMEEMVGIFTEEPTEECIISIKNLTHNRISENQLFHIEYFVSGPLLTIFIIIGVLGNALCVKALMSVRRRTAAAINAYLIALACWDLCLVITSFFLYNLNVLLNGYVPVYGNYVRSYPTFFALANASHTASIWCIVTMAAERYYALVYPLKHHRAAFDHATRAKTTLISISILALLISVPKFFEVRLIECLDVDTNVRQAYVSSSDLRRHQAYSFIYIVLGGLLFHSLTPFSILAILSIRVIIEVRRGSIMRRQISVRRRRRSTIVDMEPACDQNGGNLKWSTKYSNIASHGGNLKRDDEYGSNSKFSTKSYTYDQCHGGNLKNSTRVERSSSGKWAENRANELLPLVVIAKFFICHTTPTILDIFERLTSEEYFEGPLVGLLVDISNLLVVVNSSINVLLYAACSVYFRRRLMKIFKTIFACQKGRQTNDESCRSASYSRSTRKKKETDCVSEPLRTNFENEY